MKNILEILLPFILFFTIVYITISFIILDFNVYNWDKTTRGTLVYISFASVLMYKLKDILKRFE